MKRWVKGLLAGALALVLLMAAGCTRYEGKPGESEIAGVSMRTEKAVYPSDVREIRVLWRNDSRTDLTFGEFWKLEKWEENDWAEVNDRGEVAFFTIGYSIPSGLVMEHTYRVSTFTDTLEPGQYRAVTWCDEGQGEDLKSYTLTAPFEVA